jgi:hypothetical protein
MSQRLKINYSGDGNKGTVVFNADDIFRASFVADGFQDNLVYLYTSTGSYFTLRSVGSDGGASAIAIEKAVNDALTSNPGGRVVEITINGMIGASDMISNPSRN